MENILMLNLIGDVDEKVSTESLILPGRDEVVEGNKALLENLGFRI